MRTSWPGAAQRLAAEQFVSSCFKQHYGAEIRHFMPLLMSLSDQHDELKAVLGFRYADQHPLFLENYLDRPVEQVLATKLKRPVDRSHLVEVGNLAVNTAGGGRWLITALTAYLSTKGCEWALFTIGPLLHNAFTRLGLQLIDLAPARRESLPLGKQAHWGSYYEQKPRVMAGNIVQGHAVLWSKCQHEQPMRELWLRAEQAARQAA
ncbi:MAG: thermostable hemolysin [Chromatiales bacterium]